MVHLGIHSKRLDSEEVVGMVKKVKVRTPTGKVVIRKRRPLPKRARCARCGKALHGVPKLRPAQLRKLPKSRRRPSRAYGGYLCASCARELFREKARSLS
jgi:large subunit ribosomal protein L34e